MENMWAVVTTGPGGPERLEWRQVTRPVAGPGAVLVQVLAAAVNNTDINTRLGWYAADVTGGTGEMGQAAEGAGGWDGATPFPLIQGTDGCGRIAAVGPGVDPARVGQRVLLRPCMDDPVTGEPGARWLGSNLDGTFAQFVVVPEAEAFLIESDLSDAELASFPCAYGTAANMLHRAGVTAGMRVLVPGASGGVGSAVVQLAKRRGAEVVAMSTPSKAEGLRALGADLVLGRDEDPVQALGKSSVDVVIDNVGGAGFGRRFDVLKRGGRYVTSGAIAGPVVPLDLRALYLNDRVLIGCTAWGGGVFADVIGYIERGEIRPLVAVCFALNEIAEAQRVFQEKVHLGKIVLIPPQ